jgi:hypothetical protein
MLAGFEAHSNRKNRRRIMGGGVNYIHIFFTNVTILFLHCVQKVEG